MTDTGWYSGLDAEDVGAGAEAIRSGRADTPAGWPARAVDAGFAPDAETYYDRLNAAAIRAAREAVAEREGAPDQQLIHAVRAMDDSAQTANELAERLAEWAGAYYGEAGAGIDYARDLAARDPETPVESRVVALANRVVALADERDELRSFVQRDAPEVAPNLSALAGPVLAARLIALAGGLQDLARKPSGTLQVLGAEDALFAHLRGQAPSPKHGVIYTHEYVRGTRPEQRGSAARAVAGKLTLAARVDHYSGERKPELDEAIEARIERIRGEGDG
ncbi:MAG: NOP5/NOP56 family protein [Halobacteriales archaeon]